MSSTTPKKDKKKKSKRKSSEPSPVTPGTEAASTNNGDNGHSTKKKHKKDKKKKDKKKDRQSNDASIKRTDEQDVETSSPKQPSGKLLSILATQSNESNNTPYQIKTIVGSVALLPTSLSSVSDKVRSLLHTLLLRYDSNLGGVLLSLENDVKILPLETGTRGTTTKGLVGGRIIDDLPYVHYMFQVHGLVFCPKVGMKLKGQVIDCSQTFITLTTHHILSTKISTEKLHQQGFFFNTNTLEWSRERDTSSGQVNGNDDDVEINEELGPSTSIYLDDTVEFIVEKIRECGGHVMLDGTMPLVSTLG